MAMADCGDDEFGHVYADISMVDVDALRGFGSVCWYEDDSNVSAGFSGGQVPPPALAQCKFNASGCFMDSDELCNQHTRPQAASTAQSGSEQVAARGTEELNHCRKGDRCVEGADSDSDDDLQIVLNPHQSLQREDGEGSGDDSEDGEDFVILTGNERVDNPEWRENPEMPANDKVQSHVGEKLLGDEKGQHSGAHQGPPHIGYSGQAYRRNYKYIRGTGLGRAGATPSLGARYSYGKGDMLGFGRGFTNGQRGSAFTWGVRTPRGFSSGIDYTLPSNKTVFDIDVDTLKEKPWRLPYVDVSDYFNFGMNENSWKEYCKQLGQFCLENNSHRKMENNLHRKISVYEGGRGQQSMPNAIQVRGEGSSFAFYNEREQIRDSDAILLLNVSDDQSGSEDHEGKGTEITHDSPLKMQSDMEREDVVIKKAESTALQSTEEGGKKLGFDRGGGSRKKMEEIQNIASFPRESCRPEKARPSMASERMLLQGKRERKKETMLLQGNRDMDRRRSHSNIFNLEKDASGALHRLDVVGRKEILQHKHSALVSKGRKSLKVSVERKNSEQVLVEMEGNVAHVSKKQRLGSFSITQVSHHGSQAMKKSLKARIARAFLRAHKSEITQGRKHSSIVDTHEQYSDKNRGLSPVNGSSGHNILETGVMQAKSTSKMVEAKRLKVKSKSDSIKVLKEPPVMPFVQADEQSKLSVKGTNGSIQVPNGLLDTRCVSAEKESKASIKRKRSKKGCKHEGKSRSKDKVHLPGCPHLARRQAESRGKSLHDEILGTGCMSMNGVVFNDADDWKEGAQDVVQMSFPSHLAGKLKENNMVPGTDGWNVETGDKGDEKKRASKVRVGISFDGYYVKAGADGREIFEKVVHPCKTVHILRRKKEEVRGVLSQNMGPAVEDLGLLGHSTYEALLQCDQVNVGEKTKHKKRKKKVKKLQPEAEQPANGFTDPMAPTGHDNKKHRAKKLMKHSSDRSHQPDMTSLSVQKTQEVTASDLVATTDLMSERNAISTVFMNGQEGNAYEKVVRFDLFQSEIHSSKACNTKWPRPFTIPPIGNGTAAGRSNGNELHLGRSNGHGYGGNEFDMSGCRYNGNEVQTGTSNGFGNDGGHGFDSGGCNGNGVDSGRLMENHPAAQGPFVEQESLHVPVSDSSDEDEGKHKGRSKFERWTSHSEQVGDDVCVGFTGNGSVQSAGRISLSRSVQARKIRQCLGQANGYTANGGSENGAGLESRSWKVGRKQKGRLNGLLHRGGDHGMNGWVAQENNQQNHDQFMAKLEKRRERFNISQ